MGSKVGTSNETSMHLAMDNKESDYMDDLFGESDHVQNDLFGEADTVPVSVPALSTPKPILDRLIELQLSGCCE